MVHYYAELSAMGDIPMDAYENQSTLPANARIHDTAIPLAIISALDDPLCSWRTVAANAGLMHPSTLTSQVRSGNLVLLLTKAGGHVGWPLGWSPRARKWEWMNDASSTFAESVQLAMTEDSRVRRTSEKDDDDSEPGNKDDAQEPVYMDDECQA